MTTESPVRRDRRHRPWWRGGSSVRRWDAEVLGWAALGLGAGLLGGALLGGLVGTAVLWVALIVPVVLAFRRGIPRGLLVFRWTDLLYGVVLGSLLRVVQGLFAGAGAFPSYPSLDGQLPAFWWASDLLAGGIVAPIIEEFFFRGLLLIAIFTLVRRFVGRSSSGSDNAGIWIGGFVAVIASAGLFLVAHLLVETVSVDAAVSLVLLALVSGLLVMTTGRIWPAVLVHMVFNLSGVAVNVIGTLLG